MVWGLNGEKSLFFKTTTGIITGVLSGQQNAQISTNAIAPYATRLIGDWFQGPEKYKLASKLLAHSLVAATIAYVNESDPKIGVGASLASLLVYRRLVEIYNDGHTAIDPITKTFNPNLLPEDIKKELVSIVNVLTVVASPGLTQTKLDDAQLSSVISENITVNNELAKHTKRVWTNWDMIKEYLFGNKKIVTLEEMGLSDSVLQLIKKDNAFGLEGSIESRFLKGISNGETAFIGSYDVGGELLFSMGGGIISGTFEGEILQLEGGKKLIKGEITYIYTDVFKDALNILNSHNYIYRKEKYRNNKITDKEIKKRISDHIEAIQNGDTKNIIKYYNNDKMIDLDVPGSNKYIIVQKWKTKVERNI